MTTALRAREPAILRTRGDVAATLPFGLSEDELETVLELLEKPDRPVLRPGEETARRRWTNGRIVRNFVSLLGIELVLIGAGRHQKHVHRR